MFLKQNGQQAREKFNLLTGQGQVLSRILVPSFKQNRRTEMISKERSIVLGFVISLVTLVVLAACQPAQPIPLAVEAPRIETSLVAADSADALAYRWQALADYYEGNGLLTRNVPVLDAADVSAARWIAAAKFYEANGMLNVVTDPGDVSAARWQAMADFYEEQGLLNEAVDAGDISAARWLAMAKFYERNGLLND
jgi:hypothetical protein